MNGLHLWPLLLLGCAAGFAVSRSGDDRPYWRTGISGLTCVLLVGTLIAAAETGSATARYLGLLAVLAASAAAVMMPGVMERRWPPVPDDTDDGEEA